MFRSLFLSRNYATRSLSTSSSSSPRSPLQPARLSRIYAPIAKLDKTDSTDGLRSLKYLLRAGFVRQSSAGIYAMLPMGQRVVENIERIIEREMFNIGASKLSMPHLLSPTNWHKTGRWESTGSELFRVQDRKDSDMLLAPTHEEEITALVASDTFSEKMLPIRLFQIGRKFRDEARPRGGLLRGREFLMKDLYTFDATIEQARITYNSVREAYRRIFDKLRVPFYEALADTGNIGGESSHEFHYASKAGEDQLIMCPSCDSTTNIELAESRPLTNMTYLDDEACSVTLAEDTHSDAILAIVTLKSNQPNLAKVKRQHPSAHILHAKVQHPDKWNSLHVLLDENCAHLDTETLDTVVAAKLGGQSPLTIWPAPPTYTVGDYRMAEVDEGCRRCGATLLSISAIEVGHTFLLGTHYSAALQAQFARTSVREQSRAYFQMGCFGIGITRIVGAIAESMSDENGLRWPKGVAPFDACIISRQPDDAATVLAHLTDLTGLIEDDRYHISIGKRLEDAELTGYPLAIVIGREWTTARKIELHDRLSGDVSLMTPADLATLLCRDSA